MEESFKGIFYKTYGKNLGYSLVLLHGYLESSEIWESFAGHFADEYFVVCIDIPGHGKSDVIAEKATMDQLAEVVMEVTAHLGINGFHIVGHSMGGYVLLALADLHPEALNSAVLLHSNCFADSVEKKENRDREIELVKKGKKELIVKYNIPRMYADDNLESMSGQVEKSKEIGIRTNDAGMISALNAMKTRPDRSHILAAGKIPILIVGGKKDNLIPFEKIESMAALSERNKLLVLEKSGHMGFVEEKERTVIDLKKFFDANFECL